MGPLERSVRSAPRGDVPAELLARIDQFGVGIFQSHLDERITERRATGKHIADGRFHTGEEQAMGFVQARHDLRSHPADKRKWARRLIAFELYPDPRRKAYIVIARQ